MNDPLDQLREELRRRREETTAESCLSESTLQALADGSLSALETSAARNHMAYCLECLNAYAEVRALWEMAVSSETGPTWSRFVRRLHQAIMARVPAWIVPIAATVPIAAAIMVWARLPGTTNTGASPPRTPVSVTRLAGSACPGPEGGTSAAPTTRGGAEDGSPSGSVARIARMAEGAVVQVVPFGKEGEPRDCASGFFISADGAVATAFHAIQGAREVFVKIGNGAVFPMQGAPIGNPEADIAVLNVSGRGLPALKLGDSDKVILGESVVAIGSPFGFENSVSSGVVSGIRRQGGHIVIQTTAPISPGSSGGPLLNEKGEVIGVAVSSITQAQNLNFAVSINEVRKLEADQNMSKETGKGVLAYTTGVLYMNKRDYANAEKSLLTATRLDPMNVDAWLDLGSTYYYLRQRDKEGDAYRKAVTVEPNNSQAHYSLGTWYEDIGSFDRAIAEYRVAVTLDPTDDNAWFDLGELELVMGHRSRAIEAYERLKTLNQGLAMRLKRVIELSASQASTPERKQ